MSNTKIKRRDFFYSPGSNFQMSGEIAFDFFGKDNAYIKMEHIDIYDDVSSFCVVYGMIIDHTRGAFQFNIDASETLNWSRDKHYLIYAVDTDTNESFVLQQGIIFKETFR